MSEYTAEELRAMPTLSTGQADDLKIERLDGGGLRVWLSRMTVEDGMPYDDQITIEEYNHRDGRWVTIDEYQG